jgi:hypothetical protein
MPETEIMSGKPISLSARPTADRAPDLCRLVWALPLTDSSDSVMIKEEHENERTTLTIPFNDSMPVRLNLQQASL